MYEHGTRILESEFVISIGSYESSRYIVNDTPDKSLSDSNMFECNYITEGDHTARTYMHPTF